MGKKSQLRRTEKERIEKERKEIVRLLEREKSPWINFWKRVDFWVYVATFIAIIAFPFLRPEAFSASKTALIKTSYGNIEVELYTKDAPNTVANFVGLANKGYYNGLTWHRVVKDFVIQTGDPNGDGTGGESFWGGTFADEINPQSLGLSSTQIKSLTDKGYNYKYNLTSHKIEVGSVAMANSGPNTNGSQFFIVTDQNQPSLDGQYTCFGKVKSGMEVVKKISQVEVDDNDKPLEPVYVNSIEIE